MTSSNQGREGRHARTGKMRCWGEVWAFSSFDECFSCYREVYLEYIYRGINIGSTGGEKWSVSNSLHDERREAREDGECTT